ncbi:hypothetical protein D3C76_1851170 [compost metagenome]
MYDEINVPFLMIYDIKLFHAHPHVVVQPKVVLGPLRKPFQRANHVISKKTDSPTTEFR